jgi:hypothetical protein
MTKAYHSENVTVKHTISHNFFLYPFISFGASQMIPQFGYHEDSCTKHEYEGIPIMC